MFSFVIFFLFLIHVIIRRTMKLMTFFWKILFYFSCKYFVFFFRQFSRIFLTNVQFFLIQTKKNISFTSLLNEKINMQHFYFLFDHHKSIFLFQKSKLNIKRSFCDIISFVISHFFCSCSFSWNSYQNFWINIHISSNDDFSRRKIDFVINMIFYVLIWDCFKMFQI